LVVIWHFAHGPSGWPVPFNDSPELALLDEGHIGVALFMVLSGYLFAKLLDGRRIDFGAFLWNRFVRLAPLLAVVLVIVGLRDHPSEFAGYLKSLTLARSGPHCRTEAGRSRRKRTFTFSFPLCSRRYVDRHGHRSYCWRLL
jgi:hypothetical protein